MKEGRNLTTNPSYKAAAIFVKNVENVLKLTFWGDQGVLLQAHHSDKLTDVNDTIVIYVDFGNHFLPSKIDKMKGKLKGSSMAVNQIVGNKDFLKFSFQEKSDDEFTSKERTFTFTATSFYAIFQDTA